MRKNTDHVILSKLDLDSTGNRVTQDNKAKGS